VAQPPNVPADKGAKFGTEVTAENAVTVDQLVKELKKRKKGDQAVDVKKGEAK